MRYVDRYPYIPTRLKATGTATARICLGLRNLSLCLRETERQRQRDKEKVTVTGREATKTPHHTDDRGTWRRGVREADSWTLACDNDNSAGCNHAR